MKILLIKPPLARLLDSAVYMTYPLGLMYVGAHLVEAGHDVLIYHDDVSNPASLTREGTADIRDLKTDAGGDWLAPIEWAVEEFKPDVVGLSYCTIDVAATHKIAAMLRGRGIRTVAGGVHPSLLPEEEAELFDAVVVGEGDSPEIAGVFEDATGIVRMNAREDWGALWPLRDGVMGGERYPPYLQQIIQTQRGCPYNCSYCATPTVFGRKVRTRDPLDVRAEVASGHMTSGRVIDDSFGVNRKHALAVCEGFRDLPYGWVCDIALQNADAEMLDALALAGCYCVNVGVESAVPKWRELSGKRVNEGDPERLLDEAGERGVNVVYYFMVGWPGETQAELWQTLGYAQELKDKGAKPCISVVTAYPKTRLWDLAYGDGTRTPPPWSEFLHQSAAMGYADCSPKQWSAVLDATNIVNE